MKCALSNLAVATLSAFAVSIADARGNFVPTTSVKKNLAGFKKPALATVDFDDTDELALLSPSDAKEAHQSLQTRGGDGLIARASTSLSFYAELAWTVVIAIFMVLWWRSKRSFEIDPNSYVDEIPNFNKMVLTDGFCINPNPSGPSGLGTLKLCGIADALLIISSYFIFKNKLELGNNKKLYFGSAAYTLMHGWVHFFELDQTGQIWDSTKSLGTNVLAVGLLTLIMGVIPIGIKGVFEDAGKEGGLVAGITACIAFVAYYVIGIKERVYALTYINVTIFLSFFGARTLLLKKNDEQRLIYYNGSVLLTVLAVSANIAVTCIEPLACKAWFASVGGHIWFDVTLWLMMMSLMTLK